MHIILGASGQVGSAIVSSLTEKGERVTAIIRNNKKENELRKTGAEVRIADSLNLPALQAAIKNGDTVFLLTPETGKSEDVIDETRKILQHYKQAIESSSIKKIVGLSSIGAQYSKNSGNLEMSFMLEHAFSGLPVQKIFIRPAYYYSNWLPYLQAAKEQGVLPTFYPVDLKIPMSSPLDIAQLVADKMMETIGGDPIYEVEGPDWYSSNNVANTLGELLKRNVEAQQTPKELWHDNLQKIGFTEDAIKNFIEMTEFVNAGKAKPEGHGTIGIKVRTTLKEYLAARISQ